MSSLVPFPSPADLPEFDVSDLLQEVCDALELESLRNRVPIEVDAPPYCMIHGDRRQLRMLLIRLIGNAVAASSPGNQIIVTAYSEASGVEVEVADDRDGSVERLMTDGLGPIRGDGEPRVLAWSEVQRIVAACGARISLVDCPDGGIAITVHFPHCTDEDTRTRKAA